MHHAQHVLTISTCQSSVTECSYCLVCVCFSHCPGRHVGGNLRSSQADHRGAVWTIHMGTIQGETMKCCEAKSILPFCFQFYLLFFIFSVFFVFLLNNLIPIPSGPNLSSRRHLGRCPTGLDASSPFQSPLLPVSHTQRGDALMPNLTSIRRTLETVQFLNV